jgi:DNA repair photolyase
MATPGYPFSLALTSQFYFCALPLRLDTYSHCQFRCRYCFASARGGAGRRRQIQTADPESLRRRFGRIESGRVQGVVDEMLAAGQPVHWGGMSDPFMPRERETRASLGLLAVLADHGHPTIISSKGTLMTEGPYLQHLVRGRFMVQFSISSMNAELMAQIDPGTPKPTARIEAMRQLASAGVPVSVRVQPLLPGRERDGAHVIEAAASAGARHIAVEHLKLPLERGWHGAGVMSRALGLDLREYFEIRRSRRVGREWILPVAERLPRQLAFRELAHARGMSFAAADNDLLLLSDGACCCSGAEGLPGFESFIRFNYLEAARVGYCDNRVEWALIEDKWRPHGSISRFVNSRSRLPTDGGTGAGIRPYLERNWSGRANGCAPNAFHGLVNGGAHDDAGRPIYVFEESARRLYRSSLGPAEAADRPA